MTIEKINTEQFIEYIDWIELFDALEIHKIQNNDHKIDLLIPYLMNDCVESILRIHDCIFSSSAEHFEEAYFLDVEGTDDLVLQLKEKVVAIAFQEITIETTCYQYHDIGHNWRSTPGEEHIRRLVNLVCILHDKYRYLGETFTNNIEQELASLIEFGPFAEWSPINSSMLEWYSETEDGIKSMKKIALEAGDLDYYKLICTYENIPTSSTKRKMHYRILSANLVSPNHAQIYQTIQQKLKEASSRWEIRNYGTDINHKINQYRNQILEHFQEKGFHGKYPVLTSYNTQTDLLKRIHFVEQHPFTILESKGYLFRIYGMESSVFRKNYEVIFPQNEDISDYGFFHDDQLESSFYEIKI